ncbi:MAG: iron chelate uptake ABC transporter family permease subunit, partial [Marinobacter sp.]
MISIHQRASPAYICLPLVIICVVITFNLLSHTLPGLSHGSFDFFVGLSAPEAKVMSTAVVQFSVLPRMTIALLVGAALGLAGVLMQQVLRNPIASPTTLGVASGAQLGLLLATLFAPGLLAFGSEWVALAGGAISLLIVLSLSWHRGLAPVAVVLAGLVVNLYIGALSTVLILFHQEEFRGLMIWAAGSLAQNSWSDTLHLLPRLVVAAIIAGLMVRPLGLLELDESGARSLGISVRKLRLLSLGLSVFITASAVSLVGIVGFVGLAAPVIVKLVGARTLAQRLLWAPVFGGLLLLTTDLFLLQYSAQLPSMVPTGAMTGLLGAPLLLWLIPRLSLKGTAPNTSKATLQLTSKPTSRMFLWLLVLLLVSSIVALFVTQSTGGWIFNGTG